MSEPDAARPVRWRWARAVAPPGERSALALGFVLGAVTVFSFAPFALAWLPIVTLGVLFDMWQRASCAHAARIGFAYGAGLFATGVSWVYIALNTFGEMPAPLAATATALFCVYLALFPALAAFVATRWTTPGTLPRVVAAAAAWCVSEWIRSFLFSGFPWLGMGYAALPPAAPAALSGYAAVGGVWLVSLAYAGAGAAAALLIDALVHGRRRTLAGAGLALLAVIGTGAVLQGVDWTEAAGAPIAVSLVQGNVSQDVKFDATMREPTFRLYVDMVRASRGRVVVLPESALPAFADEIPLDVLRALLGVAVSRQGAVMTGLFTVEPPEPGHQQLRYYNSVVSLGTAQPQIYRKRHLVPFGETIPLEPIVGWFIRSVLSIPLANQSAGAADQPAFAIGGQAVAVNICYEDVFGSDIRSQAEAATLLVNVTNDAWYGRSLAAEQHNQIAAMRALETGRPLLRATNTGITSAIAHDGREIARLPWFTRGTLEIEITGRRGATPYVRQGDALAITAACMLFIVAIATARRGRRHEGGGPNRSAR